MATITIDVLSFGLVVQGSGPITTAFDVSFDDPLSMCGLYSFRVPARDEKTAELITQKTVVRIYEDGTERFLGIVEQKNLAVGPDGIAVYEISGRSFLAELEDDSVNFLGLYSGTSGVTNAPATILTEATQSWSLDGTNGHATTTGNIYARLSSESCLLALVKVAERLNEHFFYRPRLSGTDRQVIWIRDAGTVSSGVRAIQGGGESVKLENNANICLIQSLEELEDGNELVNTLIPFGGGDDLENAALQIAATTAVTDSSWIIDNSANNRVTHKVSTVTNSFRVREKTLQFGDIVPISNTDADQEAAADMLVTAAKNWLVRYSLPHKFYRLSVLKLPATVEPGQTLDVIYYEADGSTVVHDIDATLTILNIRTSYANSGETVYELTVAETDRFPSSDTDAITSRLEQSRINESYRQMGPSVDTISYAETFDDTTAATLNFWLGPEIAQVQQILLRFKIDPLRSQVESVTGASGGGSAPSSEGGSSHSHTVPMSSHTHAIEEHYHTLVVVDESAFGGKDHNLNLAIDSGTPYIAHDGGGGVGSQNVTTKLTGEGSSTSDDGGGTNETSASESAHTHTVTIAAHTHTMSNAYGLYVDSGSTISIKIDATYKWTEAAAGGRYYCDLKLGGDPGLSQPGRVKWYDGSDWEYLTYNSSVTGLGPGEWGYGDTDGLGFDTIYVRDEFGGTPPVDTDPDTLTDNYLQAGYNLIDQVTATPSLLAVLQDEITVEVNSTDRTSSVVASSVSGWYELDVTSWVSASTTTYRPTAETHTIDIQALSGGGAQGRVTAQLQIRALIQAVAYS